jgi:hypothetical protein
MPARRIAAGDRPSQGLVRSHPVRRRHGLVDADERQLSGPNLLHLHTLADYQAALDITRQQNRAPVFASRWSQELAELNAKLDAVLDRQESLAGLVAMRNGHNGNGGLQ